MAGSPGDKPPPKRPPHRSTPLRYRFDHPVAVLLAAVILWIAAYLVSALVPQPPVGLIFALGVLGWVCVIHFIDLVTPWFRRFAKRTLRIGWVLTVGLFCAVWGVFLRVGYVPAVAIPTISPSPSPSPTPILMYVEIVPEFTSKSYSLWNIANDAGVNTLIEKTFKNDPKYPVKPIPMALKVSVYNYGDVPWTDFSINLLLNYTTDMAWPSKKFVQARWEFTNCVRIVRPNSPPIVVACRQPIFEAGPLPRRVVD